MRLRQSGLEHLGQKSLVELGSKPRAYRRSCQTLTSTASNGPRSRSPEGLGVADTMNGTERVGEKIDRTGSLLAREWRGRYRRRRTVQNRQAHSTRAGVRCDWGPNCRLHGHHEPWAIMGVRKGHFTGGIGTTAEMSPKAPVP